MGEALSKQIRELLNDKPAKLGQVKEIIKLILMHTGEVTSDDVRFFVDEFDPSSMIVGTAFRQLIQEGAIRKDGNRKTDLKTSKGRNIAVYINP